MIYIVINAQGHKITSSATEQEAQEYASQFQGYGVVPSNFAFEFTDIVNGQAVRNNEFDWKGLIDALKTSPFLMKAIVSPNIGFSGTLFNDGLNFRQVESLVISIAPMVAGLASPLTEGEKNDLKNLFINYGFQVVADAIL